MSCARIAGCKIKSCSKISFRHKEPGLHYLDGIRCRGRYSEDRAGGVHKAGGEPRFTIGEKSFLEVEYEMIPMLIYLFMAWVNANRLLKGLKLRSRGGSGSGGGSLRAPRPSSRSLYSL